MKKILGLVLLVILGGPFVTQASAQPTTLPDWSKGDISQVPGVSILKATMVRITFENATTRGLCHGFVASSGHGYAFVVTAKHCVTGMSPIALTGNDPALRITIHYANGTDGDVWRLRYSPTDDVVVIVAHYIISPPASYDNLCATCPSYTDQSMATLQTPVKVVSLLSAGGGQAVLSSGLLLGGETIQTR
jgi:hypothetical protein